MLSTQGPKRACFTCYDRESTENRYSDQPGIKTPGYIANGEYPQFIQDQFDLVVSMGWQPKPVPPERCTQGLSGRRHRPIQSVTPTHQIEAEEGIDDDHGAIIGSSAISDVRPGAQPASITACTHSWREGIESIACMCADSAAIRRSCISS